MGIGLLRRILFAPIASVYGAVLANGDVGPDERVEIDEDEDAVCGAGLSCWLNLVKASSVRGFAETGVGGGGSKALSYLLRKVVGESTTLERWLKAVLERSLAGSVDSVEVCKDSFGRLGATGRGAGIVDMMALAEAIFACDIVAGSWSKEGVTGSGRRGAV